MSQSQTETLEIEAIHALFSSCTRRAVLRRLRRVERTTVSALGRDVTDCTGGREAGSSNRRDVTIALIHNHLPRLDAHDVVEYDRSEQTVTPGPNFDEIEPFLDRFERDHEE